MEWVTCNNLSQETWRRLQELANIDLAIQYIEKKHGDATTSSLKENYKKQATQIRVCLLQAKEYFDAAIKSSLITSPNHLFYGMTSLSNALMLMLGDGTKSLDYLRQDKKNQNHGLEFSLGVNNKSACKNLEILEKCYVKISPRGNFNCWYQTLPAHAKKYGLSIKQSKDGSFQDLVVLGSEIIPPFANIVGCNYKLINLAKYLPDLVSDLSRYGLDIPHSRFNEEHEINGTMEKLRWRIHGAKNPDDFRKIISKFNNNNPNYFEWKFSDGDTGGFVEITNRKGPFDGIESPSSRFSLNNTYICFNADINQHEIVDSFILCYGLSMLSRYFPDIWMTCLDSHCKSAKIIELIINTLILKFPIMILSLINDEEVVLSTHKPYWQ